MRKSRFEPYTLTKNQVARQTFKINQFMGVNYNKNALAIPDSESTDMKNLIFRDGVIQKRQGYENVCRVGAYGKNINGVYKFIGDDNLYHLIFHIDKGLYEANNLGKGSKYSEVTFTQLKDSQLNNILISNNQSFGIPSNHRLYILDGSYYYVLKKSYSGYALSRVEDDVDTYIPTTTIGITEVDSGISVRTALDDVNLLSSLRKNKLVTGLNTSGKDIYEYYLDAPIEDNRISLTDLLSKIKIVAITRKEEEGGGE